MTDDNDDTIRFSRRKLLGSVATVGAAGALGGAATNALLWDEEVFGSEGNPNVLQAGKIDLMVDWDIHYYDGIAGNGAGVDATLTQGDNPADISGPIFTLNDVKPGDALELSTYLHLYGNPAYLGGGVFILDESEGGDPNEPEDMVNGEDDNFDGTEGPDLADHIWVAQWHDDGDNIPEEVWMGETDIGPDARIEGADSDLTEEARAAFLAELTNSNDPESLFSSDADGDLGGLVAVRKLPDWDTASREWDDAVYSPLTGENADNVADEFIDDEDGDPRNDMYKCYSPTGEAVTEQLGTLFWLQRDIPGVNDNVIQGDSVNIQLGYRAIQCRHNPLKNEGAHAPIDGSVDDADAEANTDTPTPVTSTED